MKLGIPTQFDTLKMIKSSPNSEIPLVLLLDWGTCAQSPEDISEVNFFPLTKTAMKLGKPTQIDVL